MPWVRLRDALTEALSSRVFEIVEQGAWPCAPEQSAHVHLRIVEVLVLDPKELVSPATEAVWASSTPTLGKLKSALEKEKSRSLPDEAFREAVGRALDARLLALLDPARGLPAGKSLLDVRVRKPKALLSAEAVMSDKQIQDFAEAIVELKPAAPELAFGFRLTLTAEGEKPSSETIEALDSILAAVSPRLRLE